MLKKPEIIIQTISELAGQLQESVVINSLMQVERVWDELFPVEQARIISLLIKDVMVKPDGLNIRIFKEGLSSLTNELTA